MADTSKANYFWDCLINHCDNFTSKANFSFKRQEKYSAYYRLWCIWLITSTDFYFIVIEMANASIATILQFIGPFFVLAYLSLTHQQVLRRLDVLAAIMAFIGVFFCQLMEI